MKDNTLEKWVEQYTDGLYSWAVYKVSDTELAKDLVQDTFLAASEKIATFKGESSPKTWLFSILNYKVIDHYRAKAKQPVKLEDQSFSNFFNDDGEWRPDKKPQDWHGHENHLLDDADFQLILKKCLEALPEKWNACVKLKYLMDKNGDEICQELEITPTNFWQMMHRAKLSLRDCVEVNWFNN
nr:sigma-70 family RNA polymerase sigma factor [Bacteroidota bacterium]